MMRARPNKVKGASVDRTHPQHLGRHIVLSGLGNFKRHSSVVIRREQSDRPSNGVMRV